MTESKELKNLIKQSRKLVFPEQTLCRIEFDNGESTNDFIPNEILMNDLISSAGWWNEENKDDYLPLARGERKAVKATPIPDQ